jgi:hypothetical protein
MRQASTATPIIVSATMENVVGSVGWTPKSTPAGETSEPGHRGSCLLQNESHSFSEPLPTFLFAGKLLLSGCGQDIISGLSAFFGNSLFRTNPAVLLHTMERRI